MLAIERRNYILKKLQQGRPINVTELSQELGVSRMTIHRDLDIMAANGLIERVFGGAVLTASQEPETRAKKCAMCGVPITVRTKVVLQTTGGERLEACCPHCAMLLIEARGDIASGMVIDFIHGKMINIKKAVYLIAPTVLVCCSPSVIAFASEEEAKRFQAGFDGAIADLVEAQRQTIALMAIEP